MAKARMLHNKISVSGDVNKLSLPAKLLFTWMISHADDEGRLNGNPNLVKARVVPLSKWSLKAVRNYILEIKNQRLIYYWNQNDDWFIEFVNWKRYQSLRKNRFHQSNLPSYNKENENQLSAKKRPEDDQVSLQDNRIELNKTKENQSEKKIFSTNTTSLYKVKPKSFFPQNDIEQAALEAWNKIEPDNPDSFNFYLSAAKQGLPTSKFYEFSSEIKQDSSIKNKGAVFNKKVTDFLGGSE